MAGRTVKPDGEKIRRLRTERGLTVKKLATLMGCTESTITSLENSKPCYVYTLEKASRKLDVLLEELIAKDEPPAHARRVKLDIKIEADLANFDETKLVSLLKTLAAVIGARHEIEVLGIEEGSVVIQLDMDLSDVYRLLAAMRDGELEALGISQVALKEARQPDGTAWNLIGKPPKDEPGEQAEGNIKIS